MLTACGGIYKAAHPGVPRPDKKLTALVNAVAAEMGMSSGERDAARKAAKGGGGGTDTEAMHAPKPASSPKPKTPRAKKKSDDKPARKRRRTSDDGGESNASEPMEDASE
jgi:hypothetical protein